MMKNNKVWDIINAMSLEEKVGQLFILAFPGKNPQLAVDMISEFGIGGYYISQDNAETFEEAAKLTATLQKTAKTKSHGLPLILGVDQEGAWGVLIPESVIGPGNLALGLSDDVTWTERMYTIFAEEMLSVGYQTNLGPCADVNLNPANPIIGTRSFGEMPERVSRHVAAAVKALRKNGALATAKHFPGHGDTHNDSHRNIPVVDKPMDLLTHNELLPFQVAIDAGVDIIMTSHIMYPSIDKKFPATLSPAILGDLLRTRMGFKGVVITDSMNMGAIRKHYDPEVATLKAFEAGADLIMLSEEHYDHNANYRKNQETAINSVLNAFQTGKLSGALLHEKLERIIRLKLGILENSQNPNKNRLTDSEKRQIERDAAYSAVRVVQNENHVFPLKKNQSILLVNATPADSYHNLMNSRGIGPNQAEPAFKGFADTFCSIWGNVDLSSHENVSRINFSEYDVIIAVTEDHPLPGEDFEKTSQIEFVKKLVKEHNNKLMVVGLRSPYDRLQFADVGCYVCTHSGRTCAAVAAARFIAAGVC